MPCYKVCELLSAVAAVELAISIEEADSVIDVISVNQADPVTDEKLVEFSDCGSREMAAAVVLIGS